MKCFLNIGAIEIHLSARGLVIARIDYSELAKGVRTCLSDVYSQKLVIWNSKCNVLL